MNNKYNPKLESRLKVLSIVLSTVVLGLIGLMRRVKLDVNVDLSFLPPLHAMFNTCAAIALIFAYKYIIKGDIVRHKRSIFIAMGFSALFLMSYVAYHFTTEETTYCGEGIMKGIYFFFLITHIVLAGISLPFILLTFTRGISYNVAKHKKMARYVFPIWLYVAITGPICYLMLYPCY